MCLLLYFGKVSLLRWIGRECRDIPVVDEEDVSVFELGSHGVEFGADALAALFLPRHDEGPEDVAVLHEGLAIWSLELLGDG